MFFFYSGEVDIAVGPYFQSTVTVTELEPGFPHAFSKFCFLSGYRHLYYTELITAPFDLQVFYCQIVFIFTETKIFRISSDTDLCQHC